MSEGLLSVADADTAVLLGTRPALRRDGPVAVYHLSGGAGGADQQRRGRDADPARRRLDGSQRQTLLYAQGNLSGIAYAPPRRRADGTPAQENETAARSQNTPPAPAYIVAAVPDPAVGAAPDRHLLRLTVSIISPADNHRHASLIGDSEKIHPCYKLRPLLSHLEAAGVAPEAALRGSAIAPAALQLPYTLLSERQIMAVYDNFLWLAPAPVCALTLGLSCRLSDLGLYGYALHSSLRLREGYDFALRHQALCLPMTDIRLVESADDACWTIGIRSELPNRCPLRQFALDYQSGLLLAVQRHLAGPGFRLRAASLACPAPADAARYHAQLGCPIEFNARHTRLHFEPAWLDQPAPGAHALTFRLLEDACNALQHRLGIGSGIVGVIQRLLLNHPRRPPTIGHIASQLGLHPRTLRRHIAQEGASYRTIVDQARFRLAARYLADARLTHEAISEKLGFSDASSFRRAFKRWTRQSPSAFRDGSP